MSRWILIFNCTRKPAGPFPPELAAAYRQSITDDLAALAVECAHVRVVNLDAGHMCLLETPDATAQHLRSFIDQT